MTEEELTRELPKALIKWYEFKPGAEALYVGNADDVLAEALSESGARLTVEKGEGLFRLLERGEGFDYVLLASALAKTKEEQAALSMLRNLHDLLREDGTLLLCAENRLAVRFLCGDQDPYTGRGFDGIEAYTRVSPYDYERQTGRLFTKAELTTLLENAGFSVHKFYSVFPGIEAPRAIYAEGVTPGADFYLRVIPEYHSPDTVFLEEERVYPSLIENGLFHTMANGFVVECPKGGAPSPAQEIAVSMDRGREKSLCTVVRSDGIVKKRAAYPEGQERLALLEENTAALAGCGLSVVPVKVEGDSAVMPRVEGVPLVRYLQELAKKDRQEFFRQLDRLWETILASSEQAPYEQVDWEHIDPWWDDPSNLHPERAERGKWRAFAFGSEEEQRQLGPILKDGYVDLVISNAFYREDGFLFYDQEERLSNFPAKAIFRRSLELLYQGDPQFYRLLSWEELMDRYELEPCRELFGACLSHYLVHLKNEDLQRERFRKCRRNPEKVHSNRQRMNYSAEEYLRLFVHIFENMDNKKLYLFGSGLFAEKFLALYGEEYEIAGILDNDESRWGDSLEGIAILSPEVLCGQDASTYKVMICIKNYVGVLRQVRELGASNIGVYDTAMEYPRKPRAPRAADGKAEDQVPAKKYHVGYVAGVFDLFHIGHLNLLRRAKEQCDYLIAGVVTDEGVEKNKHTKSVVPFEERLAIVQACRYVDEAVGIPLEYCDTRDAYLKFRFDAQFSGSDYADDPDWLRKREFLREHGAELVFFPYTESTSSTKRKAQIGE